MLNMIKTLWKRPSGPRPSVARGDSGRFAPLDIPDIARMTPAELADLPLQPTRRRQRPG